MMIPYFSSNDKQLNNCKLLNYSAQLHWIAKHLTDRYLLFMLLVFPLFTGFSGYRAITLSKYLCFVISTTLWLLALLICRVRTDRKPKLFALSAAQRAILAFAAVAILSACCSEFGTQTIIGTSRYDGLLTLLLYCGIFFGVSHYGTFRRHHAVAFAVSITVCCCVAILQLLCYNPLDLFPSRLTYYDSGTLYTGQFLGTIGNTNLLAAFLCIGIPFFVGLYLTDSAPNRIFWLLPASLGLFVLIRSNSSGGLVALVLCALVAAPYLLQTKDRLCDAFHTAVFLAVIVGCANAVTPHYSFSSVAFTTTFNTKTSLCFAVAVTGLIFGHFCPRFPDLPPNQWRHILAFCCCFIVLLGLCFIYWYPADSGSLYELSRILHGELSDSFGSSRIRIWRAVLELVPEHPLLGGGPDTLAARLDVTFSRLVEETGVTLTTRVDNAHNEYLGYLVNLGALGLGTYLSAMSASYHTWLRQRDTIFSSAIGCAVLCYWFESLFGLGLVLTNPLLWIFWALLEISPPVTSLKDRKHDNNYGC